MADVNPSVNDRFHGAADHARHDHLLVARYGAGDAYPTEVAEAEQLVGRCSGCAQLARDIDALRLATAALPAPRRERDFQLTDAKAESLRGSPLQRVLRRLGAPGLAPLRPLAGVAVSIGLVLVVAGYALPTPAGELLNRQALDQLMPAPAADRTDDGLPPAASVAPEYVGGAAATDPPAGDAANPYEEVGLGGEIQQVDTTRSLLVYSGLLIALVSLAVLVVFTLARWRGTDPLLR